MFYFNQHKVLKSGNVKGNGIFFKALTKGEEWLLVNAQFEPTYADGDNNNAISPRGLLCKTRLATSHELHNYNYLNSIFKKRVDEANSSHSDVSPMKRKFPDTLSENSLKSCFFLFCFIGLNFNQTFCNTIERTDQ